MAKELEFYSWQKQDIFLTLTTSVVVMGPPTLLSDKYWFKVAGS
jgi:hypothetical protein